MNNEWEIKQKGILGSQYYLENQVFELKTHAQ